MPFMDLVGQLIFLNLGLNSLLGKNPERISNEFKLRLYVSFQSRKDALGLELLEALAAYCKQKGRDNFELNVRISNEGTQPRWDAEFIEA